MALLTIAEIVNMFILTFALGYIFSGFIRAPGRRVYTLHARKTFDWESLKLAAAIGAPAVILHELGHKFTAIAFGFNASFEIFWGGLALGIILKLVSAPFLILAPAYVTIPSNIPPLASALIAFAGPAVNLILWLVSSYLLKTGHYRRKTVYALVLTREINKLLFIFNLIPIPPLDGFKVLSGLAKFFGSIFSF